MKRIVWGLVAGLACSGAGFAGQTRTALHYTGYVLGLPVMSFSIELAQTQQKYDVGIDYHTTGLFGVFFPVDRQVSATGTGVRPERFEINGQARGRIYHAIVHFGPGAPVVVDLSPPQPARDPRDQFQPVPPALTLDAVDHISATLALLRQVAATGRCEREAHVFDGRMLTDLRAVTAPDEMLRADHASAFSGLAHKCIFTGTLLAGGPPPPPDGDRRRPPPVGYAWIAPIGPGGEMLLVRVAFSTPTGSLTFYLDQRQVQKF